MGQIHAPSCRQILAVHFRIHQNIPGDIRQLHGNAEVNGKWFGLRVMHSSTSHIIKPTVPATLYIAQQIAAAVEKDNGLILNQAVQQRIKNSEINACDFGKAHELRHNGSSTACLCASMS